eukprot:m.426530 g.426530  ORF g.426530 m.426530 type:complete len:412 (+) comp21355_c0_seq3:146-1381(+)
MMADSITPDVDVSRDSNDTTASLTVATKEKHTFKPKLMSSPTKRNKVQSSGYGKFVPQVPVRTPAPPPDEVSPELTFKPDTKITKKTRKHVPSTGYGKIIPQKQAVKSVDEPTFSPDLTITAKTRRAVTSTGYGKNVVSPRKFEGEKLTFQPKLDFSRRASTMRKTVPSRLLEERPKTAPEQRSRSSPKPPLLHTLAQDRSEPAREKEFEGPAFVLDGLGAANVGEVSKTLAATPPPVKHSKMGKAIKDSAAATGYGKSWTPPCVPVQPKDSPPVLHFGSDAKTYIESTDQLPVVRNKATERARPTYSSDYTPPVGNIKRPQTAEGTRADKYYPNPSDKLLSMEELPVVKNKLNHIASSGYGVLSPTSYTGTNGRSSTPQTPEVQRAVPQTPVLSTPRAPVETPEEQTTIL